MECTLIINGNKIEFKVDNTIDSILKGQDILEDFIKEHIGNSLNTLGAFDEIN